MRNRGQAAVQSFAVAQPCRPALDTTSPAPAGSAQLQLAHGRALALEAEGARFTVRSPSGEVELAVRITPDGPVLSFSAASIEIAQSGALKLRANTLEIEAREGIVIETQGSIAQRIGGSSITHCEGRVAVEAGSASIVSHKGALVIDSTHDVAIQGARVLLNC